MVEDDRGVGEGARQHGDVGDLAAVAPGLEREPPRQQGEAGAEVVAQE